MTDEVLAELYKYLIGRSWENAKTFELYQDAWKSIEEKYNVAPFDWTKGERPHQIHEYQPVPPWTPVAWQAGECDDVPTPRVSEQDDERNSREFPY
jgi:hypothetical protein